MDAQWLLAWWNVIYVLPFGLALVYLFAYAASGWTFGEMDADVDADADAGVHVGADVEAELEAEVADAGDAVAGDASDHGLHTPGTDVDADSDPTATKGVLESLAWLGVGRVPLSILLMVLLLTFGAIGFVVNQLARELMPEHLVWLVSFPLGLGGSFALTSVIARSLSRWMPMTETSARRRRELVGLRATSIFRVDEVQGVAMVRDFGGDRYQVACRTLPGRPAIAGGTEVILVGYESERGFFRVVPSGLEEAAGLPGGDEATGGASGRALGEMA